MKNILLAGGTGLIGTRLAAMLRAKGYNVRLLTRRPKGPDQYFWDPAKNELDERAMDGLDAVINLSGAGIAEKRWSERRKQMIIDSRVQSARVLFDYFHRTGILPKSYISASAIGIYGNSGESWMYEETPPVDQTFMPRCCTLWEEAAESVGALGIRTVMLRIGVVLAREGGALPEFIKPMRFGIGAYFGNGQAWYSWIHRDDLCRMFIWALETPAVEGIYNAVAPEPVRNIDLVRGISRTLRMHALIVPAPEFALRILLGEMSAVVLNSNRVSADKIRAAGFRFQYPNLESALGAL